MTWINEKNMEMEAHKDSSIKEGSFLALTGDKIPSCYKNEDLTEPIIFDRPHGFRAQLIMPQVNFSVNAVDNSVVVLGKENCYMRGIDINEEYDTANEFHGPLNCPAVIGSSTHALGVFVPFEEEAEHGLISYRNAYIACQTIMDMALGNGTTIIDSDLLAKLSTPIEHEEYPFDEDDF